MCIETVAKNMPLKVTEISHAIQILEDAGFAFKQLKFRGEGIKKGLMLEDMNMEGGDMVDRAAELAKILNAKGKDQK